MNQPKAYGSFIKCGENTFRTSAYIQWGCSDKSIGSSLLLNPDSADFNKITPSLKGYSVDHRGWINIKEFSEMNFV
jgi:hypothetical protein